MKKIFLFLFLFSLLFAGEINSQAQAIAEAGYLLQRAFPELSKNGFVWYYGNEDENYCLASRKIAGQKEIHKDDFYVYKISSALPASNFASFFLDLPSEDGQNRCLRYLSTYLFGYKNLPPTSFADYPLDDFYQEAQANIILSYSYDLFFRRQDSGDSTSSVLLLAKMESYRQSIADSTFENALSSSWYEAGKNYAYLMTKNSSPSATESLFIEINNYAALVLNQPCSIEKALNRSFLQGFLDYHLFSSPLNVETPQFGEIKDCLANYYYDDEKQKVKDDYENLLVTQDFNTEIIINSEIVWDYEGALPTKTLRGLYFKKGQSVSFSCPAFALYLENCPVLLQKYGSVYRISLSTPFTILRAGINTQNEISIYFAKKPDYSLQNGLLSINYLQTNFFTVEENYRTPLHELNLQLVGKGVPENWLSENINHELFKVYTSMPKYFERSPEKKVAEKKQDVDWYLQNFGVTEKIYRGRKFLKENYATLSAAELQHGIPKELICAILGIETNFAHDKFKGNFYTFPALVSQYLLTDRKKFSVSQLYHLYKFSRKIDKPVYYFVGSYAGASGWGQFIPSSQNSFFVDAKGDDKDIDIYSIEDNIFSIENYLYKNGLEKSKIADPKKLYAAVWSYNHSDAYVKAVLYIYQNLRDNNE